MNCWRFIALSALVLPGTAQAQLTAEQAMATARHLISTNTCQRSAGTEIIVCGTSKSPYRLPLPNERPKSDDHIAGDMPAASIDVAGNRQCGVHLGQRRCGLRELRKYGYGGGSVPIRVLVMLGKKVVDPDTELGPVSGGPITREERE